MTPDLLRNSINEAGLNVKKTADLLHVTQTCVYRWLKGTRKIPPIAWHHLQLLLRGDRKSFVLGESWKVI